MRHHQKLVKTHKLLLSKEEILTTPTNGLVKIFIVKSCEIKDAGFCSSNNDFEVFGGIHDQRKFYLTTKGKTCARPTTLKPTSQRCFLSFV